MQVANAEELDFSTRSMALELLVTLTECAPALARRCPALIAGLVPLAMSLMMDLDDSEVEWLAEKYSHMESNDCNYFVGEEAIERAAAGMGGKFVAPHVMNAVSSHFVSPQAESRRAAIAAMHRLVEGSAKFFKPHLTNAVDVLSTAINDISPRVQFEAIQMIGRLGCLYPDKTVPIINTFVPIMSARLADPVTSDKVRGHSANALINIMNPEACNADELGPHLPGLLNALCVCLQGSSLEVRAPCLTLLGCAAQVSSKAFKPFYPNFMPGIKQILHSATGEGYAELRGKAMQCVGKLFLI